MQAGGREPSTPCGGRSCCQGPGRAAPQAATEGPSAPQKPHPAFVETSVPQPRPGFSCSRPVSSPGALTRFPRDRQPRPSHLSPSELDPCPFSGPAAPAPGPRGCKCPAVSWLSRPSGPMRPLSWSPAATLPFPDVHSALCRRLWPDLGRRVQSVVLGLLGVSFLLSGSSSGHLPAQMPWATQAGRSGAAGRPGRTGYSAEPGAADGRRPPRHVPGVGAPALRPVPASVRAPVTAAAGGSGFPHWTPPRPGPACAPSYTHAAIASQTHATRNSVPLSCVPSPPPQCPPQAVRPLRAPQSSGSAPHEGGEPREASCAQ